MYILASHLFTYFKYCRVPPQAPFSIRACLIILSTTPGILHFRQPSHEVGLELASRLECSICHSSGPALWCIVRSWCVNGPDFIKTKSAQTGLRIGLPGSLALRCAAFSRCCAKQCQNPRETGSKASLGSFYDFSWPRCMWSWCVCLHSLHVW